MQNEKLHPKMASLSRTEKGQGRTETYSTYTTDDVCCQRGWQEWTGLKCIGAVHSRCETNKCVSDEWHYYIAMKALSAEELYYHVRMEWSARSMHWLLDVHVDKDRYRVHSKEHTAEPQYATQNSSQHNSHTQERKTIKAALKRHYVPLSMNLYDVSVILDKN